jgi:hypothetical protein
MTNFQNGELGGIQHKRRLAAAIPVTLRNKSWRTAHAPRWPPWSGRCRKDLGESDVKCSKIAESILKSFITDHPDAADKFYGFALLGQLAPSVPMRAAERGRSTGRRMVTISITEEAYEAIKATVLGGGR